MDADALALAALYRVHDAIEEALTIALRSENRGALHAGALADTLWPIHDQLERDVIAVKAALGPARLAAIEAAMEDDTP